MNRQLLKSLNRLLLATWKRRGFKRRSDIAKDWLTISFRSRALHKESLVAALPPDVRRGSALPFAEKDLLGAMPLVRPLAHGVRASPNEGHSPSLLTLGYGGAEPRLTSGGKAASRWTISFSGGKAASRWTISFMCKAAQQEKSIPTYILLLCKFEYDKEGVGPAQRVLKVPTW